MQSRHFILLFGALAYALGVCSMAYLIGFVSDFWLPKTINSGPVRPMAAAIAIDVALCALFAVHHSVLARESIKRRLMDWLAPTLERSSYVLVAALTLSLLMWQWSPIPATVWRVESLAWVRLLQGVCALGWVVMLLGAFTLGQPRLFGLSQSWDYFRRRSVAPDRLRVRGIYRVVRHPMYAGFIVAIWATPLMTLGHLIFSVLMTLYTVVGVKFEERDLRRTFDTDWDDRRRGTVGLPFI
jgi:protein-S-isoprenylcysteine O-methyltransferase Ste14